MLIMTHSESDMFYHNIVMGLVTRSISDFSLHVGYGDVPHIGGLLLPDIWVAGKKLYQCQTSDYDDGGRRRYSLTYQKLLDPYRYVEDNISVMTTLLAPW